MKENEEGKGFLEAAAPAAWLIAVVAVYAAASIGLSSIRLARTAADVDAVLASAGDPRRVERPAGTWGRDGRAALSGDRFILKGGKAVAIAFPVAAGGLGAACVAVVGPDGQVESVLPWGAGSAEALERMPAGILDAAVRRIAQTEAAHARK